jgi:ABC-type Fe3+ transport system substrate-binding protein
MDFIPSKEGQTVLVDFQRIPVRKDVEPKPARLFRGYQRVVERPDDYKYFTENVKLYEESSRPAERAARNRIERLQFHGQPFRK